MPSANDQSQRELWLLYLGGVLGAAHEKFSRPQLLALVQPGHAPPDIEELLRAIRTTDPLPIRRWLEQRGAPLLEHDTVFDALGRSFEAEWQKTLLGRTKLEVSYAAHIVDAVEYATLLRAIAEKIMPSKPTDADEETPKTAHG